MMQDTSKLQEIFMGLSCKALYKWKIINDLYSVVSVRYRKDTVSA